MHLYHSAENRIVPLCRDKFTSLIREEKLGEIWTPECALECLMMSGLYTEAVWFVHQLGDWKTAFIMSVASDMHQDLAPVLYRKLVYFPNVITSSVNIQWLNIY